MSRAKLIGERIEEERRRLQKVRAILLCASWSATHDVEADYGDVMSLAAELIDMTVDRLDSVALGRGESDEEENAL